MSNNTGKNKKKTKTPLTKKEKIMIIILSVAAALIVGAVIALPLLFSSNGAQTLDGVYSMSVSAADEMTSSYAFSGDRATNTYFDGEQTVTIEYLYEIRDTADGKTIIFINTADGTRSTYSFSEVTENGETVAIIINTVWYEKQ